MIERPSYLPEDTAIYEKDGELWGLDDYGEFCIDPPYGNANPQDGLCNAKLKKTLSRYGETRYCGQTPYWPADDSDEEASDYCRTHRYLDQVMENVIGFLEHGYFGRNYVILEQSLDASELAFAVDMFTGLLELSKYEFEVETEIRRVDATDDELLDRDEVVIEFPIPTSDRYNTQATELWYLALDQIVEQRMQNIRLQQGVSTSHTVATADEDGVITDRIEEGAEHHLNLPISRLTKDKKNRFKVGGVEIGADDEGGAITFTTGDYVLDFNDETPEDAPEHEEPLTTTLEDN